MKYKENLSPEIVFICPRFYINRSFQLSLGVSYIQAYLLEKGIHSLQIAQQDFDIYSLADNILRYNPRMVGIACYDGTYYIVKIITKLLKKRKRDIKIVIGGPTATFSDELIMNDCPQIDFCVRGEGEYAVYELIHFLKGRNAIEGIEGITYRRNKKVIRNTDRPLIRDNLRKDTELDILPSPYLNEILSGKESVGITTSRGCLFKCTYCNSPAISQYTVRYHSIERVISEIRKINETITSGRNNYKISIWDDNFASNTERAKQICRAIIDNKFNNLIYYCELRADRTDKELLQLLFAAGFRHVNFGLESAVPRVLRNIKKINPSDNYVGLKKEKNFIKKVKENVKLAKMAGLTPTVSVILGLPGESFNNGRKTIEFVRRLGVESYYHNQLLIFPKTELFKTYRQYGLKIKKSEDILPCYVKHAYDVSKIPYRINSLESKLLYLLSCYFTEVVFGSWGSMSDKDQFSYPAIIFNDFHHWNDQSLFEWVQKNVKIGAPLCFFYRQGSYEPHFLETLRQLMVAKEVPTRECYCLTSNNYIKNNIQLKRFELFRKEKSEHKSLYPFIFDIIPLSQIDKLNFKPKRRLEKEFEVVITLENKEDIEEFKKLVSMPVGNLERGLLTRLVGLNASFLDGCRWHEGECPALNFSKMIVQEDNTIKPCMHGAAIAKIGDSRNKIVKSLRRKFEMEKDNRGCRTCPASNRCSKCLYPYPMTVREYCRMRRDYSQTGKIIKLLTIMKDLELQRSMGFLLNIR